jgi:hypothetical protein
MNFLKRWILHPFLFGIYPVLALLAHNISQVTPLYSLRSFLIALLLAALTLVVARLILRDWRRAALVTSPAVLLFFTYGLLFTTASNLPLLGGKMGGHHWLHPVLIAAIVIVLVVLGWLSLKRLDLPSWTRTLNLFGILAVILPLAQIVWYESRNAYVSSTLARPLVNAADLGLKVPAGKTPPDIYYIILDMYTRNDAMQTNLGYDNSQFLAALEQRGFYVASCSQSNYPSTYPSLTSSLNFNYLGALSPDFSPPNTQENDMYDFLQQSAVRTVLKGLGYKIVSFESGFSPDELHDADYYYSFESDIWGELTLGGLNPFESLLTQSSAGAVLYNYSLSHPAIRGFFDQSYIVFRNRMVYAMDKLPEMPSLPGPKFVFVHLIAPHNPFAFGPNGEVVVRKTPFTLNNDQDAQNIQDFTRGYTAEVTYLDSSFLKIVDEIIKNSSTAPIIIIQGDHGIPRLANWNMTNLNVYYLPGGGESSLYPSISPVNSFRVIFNDYFGGNLDLLPDRACNNPWDDPFGCKVQVDPNPQCAKP